MINFIKKYRTLSLIMGDIIIFYFSLFVTLFIKRSMQLDYALWQQHFFPFTFIFLIWIFVFYLNGLYEINSITKFLVFIRKLTQTLLFNTALAIGFFYLFPIITPKTNLLFVLLFIAILSYLWRQFFYKILGWQALKTKIAFVGINHEVLETIKNLVNNSQSGYEVKFLLTSKKENTLVNKVSNITKTYKGLYRLNQLLKETSLDKVIVAMNPENHPVLAKELYHASSSIDFLYFPNFYEEINRKVPLEMINRLWIERNDNSKNNFYNFNKRLSDVILAIIGGIFLLILLPLLIIVYFVTDGLPIFYSQKRIGKDEKKFTIHKLRTMVKNAEKQKPLWTEENDRRVTFLGKFLRKFYIDELPQFINILKGEMSVVGPRPERPTFVKNLEKDIAFYSLRHLVRPGVTGWAQINSFYARSMKDSIEKTKYDLYYVKNYSLLFDLNIIFKTIKMVVCKKVKKNY
jgi:exopolysaccharide biosynthesis polyprenyl glycosylphosphotransferase